MINAYPINSAPINSWGSGLPAADPVIITRPARPAPADPAPPGPDGAPGYTPELAPPGFSFRWRLAVFIAGVDVTPLISGNVDIDREEGAAGIAGFDLYYPVGEPVPTEMLGQLVTIDYITETGGVTTQSRRFTGNVTEPAWDPVNRLMSISCSDRLQYRVEALAVAQIDALVGGYWSADVYDPAEGRSRWDYALERLSSVPASLDCSREGEIRLTSWYATPPAFIFQPGSTIYQSVSVDLAQLSGATNRIEINVDYRYSRLWQHNENYYWEHPDTAGLTGLGGFCAWRPNSSDLPTIGMVEQASEANGQTVLAADYFLLPPTLSDPCGTGLSWKNDFTDLLLGAEWTGARRWVQTVTERYTLVLSTAAGVVEASQVVQRQSYSAQIERQSVQDWTDKPITSVFSGSTDVHTEVVRTGVIELALRVGRTEVIAAHRNTSVSWSVPASLALDIDLTHTLELDDQGTRARGKCRRIVDQFDLLSGSAITSLSVAVMRGGGANDPLVIPARLGVAGGGGGGGGGGSAVQNLLPTQLSELGGPAYDDLLDGYAGNYDGQGDAEQFPRRLDIRAEEIPESQRDERVYTAESVYAVGIPNDLLEL